MPPEDKFREIRRGVFSAGGSLFSAHSRVLPGPRAEKGVKRSVFIFPALPALRVH